MGNQASQYLSSNHEEVKLVKKKDQEPGVDKKFQEMRYTI